MSENQAKCKYQHPDSEKECTHPVFKDGYCIFHLPKLSEEEKENISPGTEEEKCCFEIEKKFKEDFYNLTKRIYEDSGTEFFDFWTAPI